MVGPWSHQASLILFHQLSSFDVGIDRQCIILVQWYCARDTAVTSSIPFSQQMNVPSPKPQSPPSPSPSAPSPPIQWYCILPLPLLLHSGHAPAMAVSIVTFALATAWPMASSLADLKASSHSLQTQQNIDLNPKKLSHPKNIDPCHLYQNLTFLPTFCQKTFTIDIDRPVLALSQAKLAVWPKSFLKSGFW